MKNHYLERLNFTGSLLLLFLIAFSLPALGRDNGMAKVYLYSQGIPEYYLNSSSNFTARNDADITEVYGDSIGASATIENVMFPMMLNKQPDHKERANELLDLVGLGDRHHHLPAELSGGQQQRVTIAWQEGRQDHTFQRWKGC